MRNRRLTLRLEKDKQTEGTPNETFTDEVRFERRTDHVLSRTEEIALKVFAGVCVYVLLDTFRQVQIAKANNPTI